MSDTFYSDEPPTNLDSAPSRHVLSVGQLTIRVKECLQQEFSSLWVVGEISDLARPQSGHVYLTLKDEESQIRAVIWRTTAQRIEFPLDDGCEVLCRGDLDVYPPRGTYQLIIRQIEQRGEGSLQKKLRELQKRLAAEGLFDPARKRPLPYFPSHVAVITSPTGAAVRDFLQVAARRWQGPEILVMPTRVQGAEAAGEIAQSIQQANELIPLPDVIVVTRGGGSIEDLWCFNDEAVVRAIHKSNVPIVSAVGHEIDVTLADLVADVRATTPSEAAERVFPSGDQVREALLSSQERMSVLLQHRVRGASASLSAVAERTVFRRPFERTQRLARQADELTMRAARAIRNQFGTEQAALRASAARLEALSPLRVLGRGFSVTQNETGTIVADAATVKLGDAVTTRLAKGKIVSQVTKIETE